MKYVKYKQGSKTYNVILYCFIYRCSWFVPFTIVINDWYSLNDRGLPFLFTCIGLHTLSFIKVLVLGEELPLCGCKYVLWLLKEGKAWLVAID